MSALFLISDLSGGGAERVLQIVANELVCQGVKVQVLPISPSEIVYPFDERVEILPPLQEWRARDFLIPLYCILFYLRCRRAKPHSVMTVLIRANLVGLLAQSIFGVKVCISEHSDTRELLERLGSRRQIANTIIRALYPRAEKVLAVSQGVKQALTELGVDPDRVTVVHNPVPTEPEVVAEERPLRLVTMGRLAREKNQALLLWACGPLLERYDAVLEFIGDGPMLKDLQEIARQLGIGHRVIFRGWVLEPQKYLRGAAVFVFSSDFEGFGNVLVEAMACGLPVVTTDCRSGPAEIVCQGESGLLTPVGQVEKFREAVESLLQDPNKRAHYRQKSIERSKDFIPSKIVKEYRSILQL